MTRDPKEQRLKDLNRRFRSIGARQDFIAQFRRTIRKPGTWVLAFLVFAAALAGLLAMFP